MGVSGLFLLALEHQLPDQAAHNGEQDGVGEVDRQRRATRRQADEDTRDERIEQNRVKENLAPHVDLFIAATIFTRLSINEQHTCRRSASCK